MAQLVKMTGDKPGLMTIKMHENHYVYAAINTNIEQLDSNSYKWDSLILPDFALDNIHNASNDKKYSVIIAHIVKAYYNDNDTTAILANYLSDPDNAKYKSEFLEFQKIRTMAKTVANNIVSTGMF